MTRLRDAEPELLALGVETVIDPAKSFAMYLVVTAYPGDGESRCYLDVVVLNEDRPAHGLKRGDLGTVVEVYAPEAFDVEFVTASGRTQALVTLAAVRRTRSRR